MGIELTVLDSGIVSLTTFVLTGVLLSTSFGKLFSLTTIFTSLSFCCALNTLFPFCSSLGIELTTLDSVDVSLTTFVFPVVLPSISFGKLFSLFAIFTSLSFSCALKTLFPF